MRLIFREDKSTASRHLADALVDCIKAFNPTKEKPFVLGLSTGNSLRLVYQRVVQRFKAGDISFKHVVTFITDEYVGLPRDHLQSYHSCVYHHLFNHIDINPDNVNILDGNAPDLDAECQAYEERIGKVGGIELFLGSMGDGGQIAFNDAGSSLRSRTRVKPLNPETVRANARFFKGDESKVPKKVLTVGVQTILDARAVAIIVTGAHKALALKNSIEGPISHGWTLSALQLHRNSAIIVDDDAALELQSKTVKYFKSIEIIAQGSDSTHNPLAANVVGNEWTRSSSRRSGALNMESDRISRRLEQEPLKTEMEWNGLVCSMFQSRYTTRMRPQLRT